MRQKNLSEDDDKFRTALANMHYKDCTEDDIRFLKSRIVSSLPNHPSLSDTQFTLISIITARNIDKDEINKLGCIKFAKMTGQDLTDFFSQDKLHLNHDKGHPHHLHHTHAQKTTIPYGIRKTLTLHWNANND